MVNRKYVEVACEDCGALFTRRSDHKTSACKPCRGIRQSIQKTGKSIPSMLKGKNVTCDNCGKEHYKKRSQLKKGFTHHFCNSKCQGEWSAKHFVPKNFIKSADNSGEKNGRYKDGKRIGEHDRHRKLKEEIKLRDGEGCLICGTTDKIHVHRILPGGLGGKYTLENAVMLCNIHHAAVHRDYEVWKQKLTKMIESSFEKRA